MHACTLRCFFGPGGLDHFYFLSVIMNLRETKLMILLEVFLFDRRRLDDVRVMVSGGKGVLSGSEKIVPVRRGRLDALVLRASRAFRNLFEGRPSS